MSKIEFTGKLELMGGTGPSGNVGSLTMIVIPKSASAKLPSRGRVPVVGAINGFKFRSSAFPTGDGTHHIQVNREMRDGAGVQAGDRATVVIEVDTQPRVVEVPAELEKALARSRPAQAAFEKMAPSHKKEIVGCITEARKPETRERRVAQTIEKLASGTWRAK